jgi:uncharacterized protein YjbI with pentapeptide repeats
MRSTNIIIIILSLYSIASTITFITYIIKYYNLKEECELINQMTNSNNTNLSNTNLSNTNLSNTNLSNTNLSNTNLSNTWNYITYYDSDFYNLYDLIDDYNDKIIIYSKDMILCYKECEQNSNCHGFSKIHNYCYLKGKYELEYKKNISKVVLLLKP